MRRHTALFLGSLLLGCGQSGSESEAESESESEAEGECPARSDCSLADCADGFACVMTDQEGPICLVGCDPADASPCPSSCVDHLCVTIVNRLPGSPEGACIPPWGGNPGDPCAPDYCRPTLECVEEAADVAFCRLPCARTYELCPEKDFLCNSLYTDGQQTDHYACVPYRSQGSSGLDEDCGVGHTCGEGLLCVYTESAATCRPACNPQVATPCPGGGACTALSDPDGDPIGYACVAA